MGLNYHGDRIKDDPLRILEVRYYNHWSFDHQFILEVIFRVNGHVEIDDGQGGKWVERYYMMNSWFDNYYPEIVDDLKADPIKDFPMEWPLDMLDTPVAIE